MPATIDRSALAAPRLVPNAATSAAALVNPHWKADLDRQRRRCDEAGVARPAIVLFQNAPPGYDPDGRALPEGAATTAETLRKWGLTPRQLQRSFFVNLLRDAPRDRYAAPGDARHRLEYLVEQLVLRTRRPISGLVFAGAIQRDAARLANGIRGRLAWNASFLFAGMPAIVVPHTSGLCRLYNPGGIGEASGALVRPLLEG